MKIAKRKKRANNMDALTKKKILAEYVVTQKVPEIANKFNYSESAIYNIIARNCNIKKEVKDKLAENLQTAAGIVGTAALETLKEKDLSKEKVSTLSTLSSDMAKINRGDNQGVAVQINVAMPSTPDDLVSFLRPKNNETIDKPAQT